MDDYNISQDIVPKNFRQIGEKPETYKVYLEDYVSTYINQIATYDLDSSKPILLLGKKYEREEQSIYLIKGAIVCTGEQEESKVSNFLSENREELYGTKEKFFKNMDILGWAYIRCETSKIDTHYIKNYIVPSKQWENMLFMEIDKQASIEDFYMCGTFSREPLKGYYIYYDRNEEMQIYLIAWNEQRRRAVGEYEDRAIKHFRETMEEKRMQKAQGNTMMGLYILSLSLVIMICVLGITMMNNYEKMKGIEVALNNVNEYLSQNNEEEPSKRKEWSIGQAEEASIGAEGIIGSEKIEDKNPDNTEPKPQETEETTISDNTEPKPQETEGTTISDNAEPKTQETEETITSGVSEIIIKDDEKIESATPISYTVKKGDTLLSICRIRYGTDINKRIQEICNLNSILNKDNIIEGQIILLP